MGIDQIHARRRRRREGLTVAGLRDDVVVLGEPCSPIMGYFVALISSGMVDVLDNV